ncbi:hypothetical protein GCM10010103_66000 [Streptomyces paradoxus]
MAVMLTSAGGEQVALTTESVRGDNATEALADLLMGPGGAGGAVLLPSLIAVVVRRGIDVMWMAQPPIHVAAVGDGEWNIAVEGADKDDVTAFSAKDTRDLFARLQAAYSAG